MFVALNPNHMKKILLSAAMFLALQASAQTVTLFEDSFEFNDDFVIADIGEWTMVDVDLRPTYGFTGYTFTNSGVAKSFQVFNSTMTVSTATQQVTPLTPTANSNWTARTGSKNLVCFAAVPNATVTANNDWAITPQITLNASGNTLKFWAKSCSTDYGIERFKVGVSTTGTAPSDFTIITAGPYLTTLNNVTWVEYTYNLDNYANQPVYVGINCVSNDQFGFAVDDVSITANVMSTESFVASNFSVFPNPANDLVNINAKNGMAVQSVQLADLNGRIVKNLNVNAVQAQVSLGDLQSGVYLLKIVTDQGSGSTRIVKN